MIATLFAHESAANGATSSQYELYLEEFCSLIDSVWDCLHPSNTATDTSRQEVKSEAGATELR